MSPKGPVNELNLITMGKANEIKFIAGLPEWKQHITDVLCDTSNFLRRQLIKWIIPLAKPYPYRLSDGLIEQNVKDAVQYCLDNPQFRFCMQMHKVLGIK